MKHAFLLLLFALALPAPAEQLLHVGTDGQASDLRCPAVRAKPRVAPAKPGKQASEELSLPEREDVEDILSTRGTAHQSSDFERPSASGRPLNIAFWGDSHLAAGFFGEELAKLSGFAKTEVQPTFIPAGIGRGGVRLPVRKHCLGPGWQYKFAYFRQAQPAAFPPGLSQLRSVDDDAYLWVDFRQQADTPALKSVDLLFAPPREGEAPVVLGLSIDDAPEQLLTLEATDGILRIVAESALSTVRLRVAEGRPVFEGFRPHYLTNAALRLDTLAIPGSTIRGWSNIDPAYLKSRLGDIDYDFIALEYGTNEGNQRPFDASIYAADLRNALSNLRQAFPAARCVLIGPTDRGILVRQAKNRKRARKPAPPAKRPDLMHFARIHQEIGLIQRRIGQEFQCAFWSWQDAMGGPGGAYRWLYSTPRLMAKDLIHLSVPGYQQSARSFAEDLRFQEWFSTPR